jgi:hypothetical protein
MISIMCIPGSEFGETRMLTLVDPPGRLTSPTGSQSCILGNPDHRKRPFNGRHPHIGSIRVTGPGQLGPVPGIHSMDGKRSSAFLLEGKRGNPIS